MKKLLLSLFILTINFGFSQSIMSYIKDRVDSHLSSKLDDRYKGGLDISDATQSGNYYIVEGSFRYQIKTMFGSGNTVTRKFKAKIKQILDDITVQKLCYIFIEYGYSETPQKSCKCSDGSFVSYSNELYVE